MYLIIISSLLGILMLNFYASFRLWKKAEFSLIQKIIQSAIIWLLPILGAIIILVFIKEDETPKGPYNQDDGLGENSMGEAG